MLKSRAEAVGQALASLPKGTLVERGSARRTLAQGARRQPNGFPCALLKGRAEAVGGEPARPCPRGRAGAFSHCPVSRPALSSLCCSVACQCCPTSLTPAPSLLPQPETFSISCTPCCQSLRLSQTHACPGHRPREKRAAFCASQWLSTSVTATIQSVLWSPLPDYPFGQPVARANASRCWSPNTLPGGEGAYRLQH